MFKPLTIRFYIFENSLFTTRFSKALKISNEFMLCFYKVILNVIFYYIEEMNFFSLKKKIHSLLLTSGFDVM